MSKTRKIPVSAQHNNQRIRIAVVEVPEDMDPLHAEGLAVIRTVKFLPENFARGLTFLRAEPSYS